MSFLSGVIIFLLLLKHSNHCHVETTSSERLQQLKIHCNKIIIKPLSTGAALQKLNEKVSFSASYLFYTMTNIPFINHEPVMMKNS